MRFLGGLGKEFVLDYLLGLIKPCLEISFRRQLEEGELELGHQF
jgi:hypothetical protein